MDSSKFNKLRNKNLESIQNSELVSSPLRRKSLGQTAAISISENDDEAERIARRERLSASTTSPTNNSRRVSLGLGFLANIPVPQMTESINRCIKLSAENKINTKNAFSLEMIDFMTYMIKKQDANMSNLQVASTSLDVSSKIYGYRVDNVHTQILKMSGGLDKQTHDNEQEAMQENAEGNVEVQKKTRKKKTRQKLISTVEALRGNIEIIKPMSTMIGEGDLQTSDMLYQAILPNHANSGFYQHLYNDVIVDILENTSESQGNSDAKYTIPTIKNFMDSEICLSFSNFKFLGWSVEDEPEEMEVEENEPDNENSDRFQFDLNASVQHDDPEPEPMNYFDIEHDDNENDLRICCEEAAGHLNANIVNASNVRASEYSFVQGKRSILHWAGSSHWKFWKFPRASTVIEGSTKVVACMQANQRKKKQFEMTYDIEETDAYDTIDAKFASSHSIKLHAKTAKAEWSASILTLPDDVHYDVAQLNKLYMYQGRVIKPANNGDKDGNSMTAEDLSDGERYDYNNPNDTLDYCPNIERDGDYDGNGDDDNNDCNYNNAIVLNSQGLTGDNLVAAPKLVNTVPIAYCLKAKSIDMRQLKKSIWSCLTSRNDNAADTERPIETDMMMESKKFSDIYRTLPSLLTKSNAEALSVPISFISMLHIANEKGLKVCSVPDMSDIVVDPGESPLT